LGDGGHPGIGLDRKDVGASLDELHRRNPGAGTRIKDTVSTRRQHVVDQLVGVPRTMRVIVVCRATK
jgi:hypothetical protein